jgi:hypothetical protein
LAPTGAKDRFSLPSFLSIPQTGSLQKPRFGRRQEPLEVFNLSVVVKPAAGSETNVDGRVFGIVRTLAHVQTPRLFGCRVQKIASSISEGPTDEEAAALLVTGLTALNALELFED